MNRKWKNILIILGTTGVVYFSFCYLLPLVVPFVFAFVFAKLTQPAVQKLHKCCHINEKVCSFLIIIIFLGAIGSFLFYVGYICIDQLAELLKHAPAHAGVCTRMCERACRGIDNLLGLGPGVTYVWVEESLADMDGKISQIYLPKLTGYIPAMLRTLGEWGAGFVVFIMATFLISFDKDRNVRYRSLMPYVKRLKTTGLAYLKVQGIIIFIVAAVCVAGLLLIKNPYAILLGIVIGIVDALPIFGSGTILVPWAVFELIRKDFFCGAVLITLYVITLVLREILEPRLMGKEMGLKPLYVLMSVYVGIKLFGLGGILLGPVGLTILKTVAETKIKV